MGRRRWNGFHALDCLRLAEEAEDLAVIGPRRAGSQEARPALGVKRLPDRLELGPFPASWAWERQSNRGQPVCVAEVSDAIQVYPELP